MMRNRHGGLVRGACRARGTRSEPGSPGTASGGLALLGGWAIAIGALAGCSAPGRAAAAEKPRPAPAAEAATPEPAAVAAEAAPLPAGEEEAGEEAAAVAAGDEAPDGEEAPAAAEFPWPPPRPSSVLVLPTGLFEHGRALRTVGELDRALSGALAQSGYTAKRYYRVPGGFALVTQLERIDGDGQSSALPDRWFAGPGRMEQFSFGAYLRALAGAKPGHYRLLVFVVTDTRVTGPAAGASAVDGPRWLARGGARLPAGIAAQRWSRSDRCSALIYEFEWDREQAPYVLRPGRIEASLHLDRSGLWMALATPPPP